MSLYTDDILDLTASIGQRSATFAFTIVDGVTGSHVGEIETAQVGATIEHDATATIPRMLSNLVISASELDIIDLFRHRILVSMIVMLPTLGGGTERRTFPLGRFVFVDVTVLTRSAGRTATCALTDEMFIVDQTIAAPFLGQNRTADVVVASLVSGLPIAGTSIAPNAAPIPLEWPSGTRRGAILSDITGLAGYANPWFDNAGVLRVINVVDPSIALPTITLTAGSRILAEGVTLVSDVLESPNRYIVNGVGTATPVQGVYDVPASAPWSIANRGFVVPSIHDKQVTTVARANAWAYVIAHKSRHVERIELSTIPDPRHDGWDVLAIDGDNYLEIGWSLELRDGAPMRHILTRTYR